MKKLLIAFGWLFFAGFASAATLTGVVQDTLSNEPLFGVSVSVADETAKTNENGEFELDFTLDPQNPAKIVFSKDAYLDLVGTISLVPPTTDQYIVKIGGVEFTPDFSGNFVFEMMPKPVEIISGKITAKCNGDTQDLLWDKVEITAKDADGEILQVNTKEKDRKYTVLGYFSKDGKSRDIEMTFKYPGYKDVEKSFPVKTIKVETKETNIEFTEQNLASKQEAMLKGITGFDCNETMPRYLIGANCEENKTLEGDAADLAMLMQKFGGKITGMIGMIAVLFIIWNSFKIVTAAGDKTKISEAKQGLYL